MDARDVGWADQAYAEMGSIIRRHGWAVQYVGGSLCDRPGCGGGDGYGPTFAYTVGLFGLGHPELLVFSLPPEAAVMVLDGFGERVRRGEHLIEGQLLSLSSAVTIGSAPRRSPTPGRSSLLPATSTRVRRGRRCRCHGSATTTAPGSSPGTNGCSCAEMHPRPGRFRHWGFAVERLNSPGPRARPAVGRRRV